MQTQLLNCSTMQCRSTGEKVLGQGGQAESGNLQGVAQHLTATCPCCLAKILSRNHQSLAISTHLPNNLPERHSPFDGIFNEWYQHDKGQPPHSNSDAAMQYASCAMCFAHRIATSTSVARLFCCFLRFKGFENVSWWGPNKSHGTDTPRSNSKSTFKAQSSPFRDMQTYVM